VNEKDKYKRSHPCGSENVETTGSLLLRDLEHNPISLKTFLAIVLAVPFGGIIVGGIVSYRTALSTIDTRLDERAPTILQSIHDKLGSIRVEIGRIETKIEAHEKRLDRVEDKK